MTRKILALLFVFAAGAIVGHLATRSAAVVQAQSRKPVMMLRMFTGPDNQTHAEEVPLDFAGGASKLLPITSGELHVASPGNVIDWHRAPRRQYVITLSGHGELEVAGGKKIPVGPGQIDLVEDTTGKGHITRVTGTEDRITLQLRLADQAGN
ncbi:MAG: hypothetical protein ABI833_02160 [Acidobacteriota bacterium]